MIPTFVVVRSSYNDKFYAGLAREAIKAWKDRRIWGDTYHEYVFSPDPRITLDILILPLLV